MNSEIVADQPIVLFLTRTWRWSEGDQYEIDVDVMDAEVKLIVNDKFKEMLHPSTIVNEHYNTTIYPEIRKCYKSNYVARSGDVIRLESISKEYGEASAEVQVPFPVPIDRIEMQPLKLYEYGSTSGFPDTTEKCQYTLSFRLLVYFTDPDSSGNYYDFKIANSPYNDYDNKAEAYIFNSWPDLSGEPLFTEHVSVLESAIAEVSGYTIFTDRQINGLSYPLHIKFDSSNYVYYNPLNLKDPKEYGMVATLRHVDEDYYKHVLSLWEGNDAIAGALSGVGLANPIYAYSNVSTGAGCVAAYAISQKTIPMVDVVMSFNKK